MRRLCLTSLLLCCLCGLVGVPAAQASHNQTVLFEAPSDLLNAATRPAALAKLDHLGVRALRVILLWQNVSPGPDAKVKPKFDATDPAAYYWGGYDAVLAAAKQRGWQVLLTVSGPVPTWATSTGVGHVTRPDPADFQAFMTAVGRHYGSQVKLYSIWNEPNEPVFLAPQFQNGQPASPRIYRGLFQAGVAGLRASGNFAGAKVLMGETAPRGTGNVVAPLTFLRGVLCLNGAYRMASSCSALPADGYAHHAYTTRAGPSFVPPGPNDVTIGVLGRLTTALNRAAAAGAVRANLPIYLTEFGIQSLPDPVYGVSLAQQAEYIGISEHIAWENPRVVFFSQYLLRDDQPRPGPLLSRYSGFESGLELASGVEKPSYSAWPVPLVVTRAGGSVSFWGLARPAHAATSVVLQVADGKGAFRNLMTVRTNSLGYWTGRSTWKHGRRWRVRWTSPGGTVYLGPPIRAYDAAGHLAA